MLHFHELAFRQLDDATHALVAAKRSPRNTSPAE
jgi:hypothetical protein